MDLKKVIHNFILDQTLIHIGDNVKVVEVNKEKNITIKALKEDIKELEKELIAVGIH